MRRRLSKLCQWSTAYLNAVPEVARRRWRSPESVVAAYVLTGLHVVVHFVFVHAEVAAPLCRIAAPATSRQPLR